MEIHKHNLRGKKAAAKNDFNSLKPSDSKLTIIGSDNSLLPGQHQAIIWITAGILLIGPFEINFNKILIRIHQFSFKKMRSKVSSAKCRPFCLNNNELD